jgi:hypothetical protein
MTTKTAWPKRWPKMERKDGKPATAAPNRLLEKAEDAFPDTRAKNISSRVKRTVKRRAKNKAARATRKAARR